MKWGKIEGRDYQIVSSENKNRMNKGKNYIRSFEDEVDWKIIDQLHNATNRFSATSLELKKIYLVILGISIPIIFKLANEKLDISLLSAPLILSFLFWMLDALTYYYQEKLREKMDYHFTKLKYRNHNTNSSNSDEDYTLENSRTINSRLLRSLFNFSSSLYYALIFLNLCLIIYYYAR